jgi:hypothetical protein
MWLGVMGEEVVLRGQLAYEYMLLAVLCEGMTLVQSLNLAIGAWGWFPVPGLSAALRKPLQIPALDSHTVSQTDGPRQPTHHRIQSVPELSSEGRGCQVHRLHNAEVSLFLRPVTSTPSLHLMVVTFKHLRYLLEARRWARRVPTGEAPQLAQELCVYSPLEAIVDHPGFDHPTGCGQHGGLGCTFATPLV